MEIGKRRRGASEGEQNQQAPPLDLEEFCSFPPQKNTRPNPKFDAILPFNEAEQEAVSSRLALSWTSATSKKLTSRSASSLRHSTESWCLERGEEEEEEEQEGEEEEQEEEQEGEEQEQEREGDKELPLGRPVISSEALEDFMNPDKLDAFLAEHGIQAEEFSFDQTPSIGEGGREFLRSSLQKFVKGRQIQKANVRQLLQHAHDCGLWRLVQRIVAERKVNILSGLHQSFVDFKNAQSRRRRRRGNPCMHFIRDERGEIRSIIYEKRVSRPAAVHRPCKYLPIGVRGRHQLKLAISKHTRENAAKAVALLEEFGLGRVRLREATVPELLGMAWVLGLWSTVEQIVRENEAKTRSQGLAAEKDGATASGSSPEGERRKVDLRHLSKDSFSLNAQRKTEQESLPERKYEDWDVTCKQLVQEALESMRKETDAQKATSTQTPKENTSLRKFDPWFCESPPSPTPPAVQTPGEGPLQRIARLVTGVDPTSPEAKPAAAQVVKELMTCMREGLLPPPPPELMNQLRAVALKLGVSL